MTDEILTEVDTNINLNFNHPENNILIEDL